MVACPACGAESPEAFRFCPACATPLGQAATSPPTEERKVVTALFCDLVGFTATSESADPEDIDRMLSAYFALARTQIEAHGGVVEKFIGDAVLGVFGVPAAHEDDPERAVRSALRIVEDAVRLTGIGGSPLRLRIGINTGAALVRLGISPGSGERFLAGDAINTASRIQSVAPEMGVAVGLGTHEATRAVFEYRELEPATLKGKTEPVRVFHAIAPRARLGVDLTRTHDSPFVGREIDRALLTGLFDETVGGSTVQLVTVVGEPGIGKSRIVAELLGHAQAAAPALTWRQGRCLPYGDGVTFWALGEIVKAQAGILETDDPEVATHKMDDAVPAGPDRDWLRQRLLPLVGVDASSAAEREELFTAWRTFLEAVAEQSPTVLVFEDIHWADDAMLAFLEHLAHRAEGVPLLLVATARPELFERHPTFTEGLPNVNRINLAPLTDEETSRVVAGRLGAAVPPELQAPILERAEGNPLYAEEFVRLLRDRDLVVEMDGTVSLRPGSEVPLPESIGALIAARLDTLPAERKAILADAAVVGKVFWAGAVAAMGGRDITDVTEAMRDLARIELVRAARRSSMAGETEYSFWHVLVRDVAYAQLPRAARATRHVAAARWLEARAGERAEDIAEVLAHHYATAHGLAQAAGNEEQAAQVARPALRFLTLAGEKALGLDTAASIANFELALRFAPEGDAERAGLLVGYAEAALQAARFADSARALEEAIDAAHATGNVLTVARAMRLLGRALARTADPRRLTLADEALALLEPLGPSPELVAAYTDAAGRQAVEGDDRATTIAIAERALVLAEELGLPRPARALGFRAMARADGGDRGSLVDFQDALAGATEAGHGREIALLHLNYGFILGFFEGPAAALDMLRRGRSIAESRGIVEQAEVLTTTTLDALVDLGEHDEALRLADIMLPKALDRGDLWGVLNVRWAQGRIGTLRGEVDVAWLDGLLSETRALSNPQALACTLAVGSLVRSSSAEGEAVEDLLTELESMPLPPDAYYLAPYLPPIVRAALKHGLSGLAHRLADSLAPLHPYTDHSSVAARAALSEAAGELRIATDAYAEAANRWDRFGVLPEQAFALLGQGRSLLALHRPSEARPVLREAREIFERLGAAPALAETDALIQKLSSHVAATP
jgi:class 3 adenylate cyclase/tetratricopeptide (TPR) repeat protein